MHLRKKIKINKYLFGTVLNFSFALYVLKMNMEVAILFLGFILNQIFLTMALQLMFSGEANKRASLYLVLKFMVLAGVMIYAMSKMPEKNLLITLFYIFQLIILVISIKRNTK